MEGILKREKERKGKENRDERELENNKSSEL